MRTPLVVVGVLLLLVGAVAFAWFQTQELFQDTRGADISPGATPRNDGGILFGATVAGLGCTAILLGLSRRPFLERWLPAVTFLLAFVGLLTAHFTIFVNALIFPGLTLARVEASFLFHDAATSIPIASTILALVTLLALVALALSAMALITPRILAYRFAAPADLDSLRTRTAVLSLLLLAGGAAFVRQFLAFALRNDSQPSPAGFASNGVFVYYLLAFGLAALLGIVVWRTITVLWGDHRQSSSLSFRRGHTYLLHAETWLWLLLGVLNIAVASLPPVYQPALGDDKVFAMNSKGVSVFLFLVLVVYVFQRRSSLALVQYFTQQRPASVVRRDHLALLCVTIVGIWTLLTLAMEPVGMSGLAKLAVRCGVLALILPFLAMRIEFQAFGGPRLRHEGSAIVLLGAALLSILVGFMLWGIGNTVTTSYSTNGGFVTPEESVLQPYSTGLRILASLFIAAPVTMVLWFLTARTRQIVHPGPLLIAFFSIIVAMHFLLTINAADPGNPTLGQTEVLIGFNLVGLATTFDRVVLLLFWCMSVGVGAVAIALLLHRGAERLGTRPPVRSA